MSILTKTIVLFRKPFSLALWRCSRTKGTRSVVKYPMTRYGFQATTNKLFWGGVGNYSAQAGVLMISWHVSPQLHLSGSTKPTRVPVTSGSRGDQLLDLTETESGSHPFLPVFLFPSVTQTQMEATPKKGKPQKKVT